MLQKIADELHILPYQLFLENPDMRGEKYSAREIIQVATDIKQKIIKQIDDLIENYGSH